MIVRIGGGEEIRTHWCCSTFVVFILFRSVTVPGGSWVVLGISNITLHHISLLKSQRMWRYVLHTCFLRIHEWNIQTLWKSFACHPRIILLNVNITDLAPYIFLVSFATLFPHTRHFLACSFGWNSRRHLEFLSHFFVFVGVLLTTYGKSVADRDEKQVFCSTKKNGIFRCRQLQKTYVEQGMAGTMEK